MWQFFGACLVSASRLTYSIKVDDIYVDLAGETALPLIFYNGADDVGQTMLRRSGL
jgi:hypothetical protein